MNYILVGNKCDLENQREVPFIDGYNFAKDRNMIFLETSAKKGHKVQDVFIFYNRVLPNLVKE